jgi:hypothetical protein
MVQVTEYLALPKEPRLLQRRDACLCRDHLERDVLSAQFIERAIHDTGAATPHDAFDGKTLAEPISSDLERHVPP